jgi:hypothetical protein
MFDEYTYLTAKIVRMSFVSVSDTAYIRKKLPVIIKKGKEKL